MEPEKSPTPNPIPQVQQPVPTPKPIIKKTNWLVSILFLLIGLALGAGSFWAYQNYFAPKTSPSPTPEETQTPEPTSTPSPTVDTSTWQTYTDPDNKFSFKYPTNLSSTKGVVSRPYIGSSKFIQTLSDPSTILENTDAPFDGFSIYEQDTNFLKGISFNDYLQQERNAIIQSPRGLPSATIQTISFTNNSFSYINSSSTTTSFFIESPDNQTIIIFARINKTDEFINTFNQILSTFQFTTNSPS